MKIALIIIFLSLLHLNAQVSVPIESLDKHERLHLIEQFKKKYASSQIIEQQEGLEKWNRFADEALKLPPHEVIERLGEGVRKTADLDIYNIDKTKEVASKLRETMMSIPGYAIYYKDKIEAKRAEELAYKDLSPEERDKYDTERAGRPSISSIENLDYETYSSYALKTLEFLPSPETVAVLGHFLNDTDRRVGSPLEHAVSDIVPPPKIAELAVGSIEKLGIEHPPVREKDTESHSGYYSPHIIDAWKDWWNEVAAGKRTYRFIGSDVEFGPNGPVSKEKLERIHQDRQRDAERENVKGKPGDVKTAASVVALSRPLPLAGILATAILAVSGGWYFLKRRKAA